MMVLRRIADALRRMDWSTAALEVAIVVIGIFLALQADDWNTARKDRVEERIYLERILADTENSIARQQEDLDFMRENRRAFNVVLDRLRDGELRPEQVADFEIGLRKGARSNPIVLNRTSILELQASGKIGLVRDLRLRQAIGEISSFYDIQSVKLDYPREAMGSAVAYLMQYAVAPQTRTSEDVSADMIDYDFDEMTEDKRVYRAALTLQAGYGTVIYFHERFHVETIAFRDLVAATLESY